MATQNLGRLQGRALGTAISVVDGKDGTKALIWLLEEMVMEGKLNLTAAYRLRKREQNK